MTYVLIVICCDQFDFLRVLIMINYLYVQSSGTIYIFKENYKLPLKILDKYFCLMKK